MPEASTSISVRMYNPGFGDCFLITAQRDQATWRALIDCGVHPHGRARPIEETVAAVIADLGAARPQPLHLDLVVATHRHADHVSGFAQPAWDQVTVDEVWLPFTEDPDDAAAAELRGLHAAAASRLTTLTATGQDNPTLAMAAAMAVNAASNAKAMTRLSTGRFANTAEVHYLPAAQPDGPQPIETTVPGVTVHVLGPPRDLAHLKRMDPPAAVAWLAADQGTPAGDPAGTDHPMPLFSPGFLLPDEQVSPQMRNIWELARLGDAADPAGELLAAAAALDRALNNTSLFLAITAGGLRLVFPGDAQQGAWEHVLGDPARAALVSDPAFYKVGHHGSHNATPKPYVTDHLGTGKWAMLPFGLVPEWADTIPKQHLLDALASLDTHLVRADQAPLGDPAVTADPSGLWSQVTLTAPAN
jgi:hypothetical protein